MTGKATSWLAGGILTATVIAAGGHSPSLQGASSRRPFTADSLWQQMERGPHAGSLQDALVGVEVTAASTDGAVKRIRRGNGLVLRCDGFILVPTALFNATVEVAGTTEDAQLQITIVTRPGMEGERRFAAHRPRYERLSLGYTVVKVANWHGTAMTTETPEGLRRGDRLDVYWTDWDAMAKKWLPVKRVLARAGSLPAEPDKARPGRRPFSEAIERAPPGALVCSESGRAVGVVIGGSAEKGTEEFEGFDALGLATNCVVPEAPQPHAEAAENGNAAAAGPAKTASDMVKVPGGPVMLPPSVIQMQPDMEGAKYACVAPFEIDKFEVTNKQYLEFWNGQPAENKKHIWFQSQYWPACWSKRGEPFPQEIADFPVLGVPTPGAEAFARSQGKRLPTPYEWCLAAFGRDGGTIPPEMINAYLSDRRSIWEKACNLHFEYRETRLAANQNSKNPEMYQLPWIAQSPDLMEASAWSKRTLELIVDPIRRQYVDPDYLTTVGARELDDSPFGARDMILNAAELVVSHPGPPARGNDRYMVSEFLPAKLPRDAQFVPRLTELIGAREGNPEFPHLSRLFRRLINGPSTPDLIAWSHVAEMQRMLAPVGSWEIQMTALQQTGYLGRPPARGLAALGRSPGLKLWEQMPKHFRIEMGLPIPLDEIDRRIPTGPSLFYMPAGGFRCARGL